MFDIFIPCTKKDETILNYCLNSLKYITNFQGKIYVCSNFPVKEKLANVTYLRDEDVLDISYENKGWIYQQLLKLLQTQTINDYVTIDADTILLENIELQHGEFIITNEGSSLGAFNSFLVKNFPEAIVNSTNYISEIMYFKRNIINEMIGKLFTTKENFIKEVNERGGDKCFSEFLLYGNYINKFYSEDHSLKKLSWRGKEYTTRSFKKEEIEAFMISKRKYDIISMHTRLKII